jgi:ketosteroid isomerase-like protein
MSKIKKQKSVAQGNTAADVEANFYEALQAGDIEKLMACWADEDEIVCVHPGGPRLSGMAAIRAAFDAMFSQASIRAWPQGILKIESMTSVIHNVRERIEVLTEEGLRDAYVLATNVYHKTPLGWRMVLHHVSQDAEQDAQETSEVPHVLH